MKVSAFVATSVDGFVAREDGGIDWLPAADGGEDYGFGELMASVDALVMGRNSFEAVAALEAWPYGETRVVVLTHRALDIPAAVTGTVETMEGPPREIVCRLAERGAGHLYVDGAATIQAFLADGLVDQLIITRVPVLLGSGIPLFGPLPGDLVLRHAATRELPGGLVQSRYEVLGGGA